MTDTAWPCPECGQDLNPIIQREPLRFRQWLTSPITTWHSWRFRRYADSPDGRRYFAALHMLVNHGAFETLHALSDAVAATWNAPPPPPQKP